MLQLTCEKCAQAGGIANAPEDSACMCSKSHQGAGLWPAVMQHAQHRQKIHSLHLLTWINKGAQANGSDMATPAGCCIPYDVGHCKTTRYNNWMHVLFDAQI